MELDKAIKILKDITSNFILMGSEIEAIDLAIKSLEKEKPLKPIYRSWMHTLCPNCSSYLSRHEGDGYYTNLTEIKICQCGQRIDWASDYFGEGD